MSENEFIEGERKIRKKYNLLLLIDLLYYYYQNSTDLNVNSIVNSLQDAIVYDENEKKELVKEAKEIFRNKYNIELWKYKLNFLFFMIQYFLSVVRIMRNITRGKFIELIGETIYHRKAVLKKLPKESKEKSKDENRIKLSTEIIMDIK